MLMDISVSTLWSEPSDFQSDMQYDSGKHCVFYHRYHVVWSTNCRNKVLTGALRVRVRWQ